MVLCAIILYSLNSQLIHDLLSIRHMQANYCDKHSFHVCVDLYLYFNDVLPFLYFTVFYISMKSSDVLYS